MASKGGGLIALLSVICVVMVRRHYSNLHEGIADSSYLIIGGIIAAVILLIVMFRDG